MVKKNILFVLLACFVISSNVLVAQKVVMKIYPDEKFEYKVGSCSTQRELVYATLEGWGDAAVRIRSDLNNRFSQLSRANLLSLGKAGSSDPYPLVLHKICLLQNFAMSNSLEIVIHDKKTQSYKPVNLPACMLKRVLQYLQSGEIVDGYHCHHFVEWVMYGDTYTMKMVVRYSLNYWKQRVYCCSRAYNSELEEIPDDIVPGSVLVFYDDKKELQHSALALSDELCLSKFGSLGPLTVSTIQALFNLYECAYVEILM